LATTVYSVEELTLQNGSTIKLKPLSIKELRKFMNVLQAASDSTTECGGIKMDDPNLLAAAVLAGQN